ncbi:GBF-interacting protein 1-like [Aegilops tauschii subsp. strangulata]|nr:GBF-interacting protein 1-like isoform X1 [Aegilops tauschii subsp. strangulata]
MAAARVSIPAAVRRTIQNIKEIAGNHTDEEVYAALRECDMDPNETAQKLLHQDTFHEVKRKRDKKKESNKESVDPRWRPGTQGRGGKGGRGNYSSRQLSNSSDGTGRNAPAGKENDLNPSMDKCTSPSPVNPSTETKLSTSILSSSGGLSNGPSQPLAPVAKYSQPTCHLPPSDSKGLAGVKGTPEEAVLDLGSHVNNSSIQALGVGTSVSDPLLTPPLQPHSHGGEIVANKHAVRNQRSAGEYKVVSDDASALPKDTPQSSGSSSTVLPSGSRPSSSYSSRSQQPSGSQKAVPNKEWKPKPTNKPAQAENVTRDDVAVTVEVVPQSVPAPTPINKEDISSGLDKRLGDMQLFDKQHVIIPDHLQVTESEKYGLSFGSFGTSFEQAPSFPNDHGSEKSSILPEYESSQDLEEVAEEPASSHKSASSTVEAAAESGQQQLTAEMTDNISPQEADNLSSTPKVAEFDESKDTAASHMPQDSVQNAYSTFAVPPQSQGNQIPLLETSEYQVQQPNDFSANYYTQIYRPMADADGHISPFTAPGAAIKSGNMPVLPSQTGQTPEELNSVMLSSSGPTPLATPTPGAVPSSISIPQQPLPMFRQPVGVHVPHYQPSFIPYNQYISPFYVPPHALHHFMGNAAFPQAPSPGSMYPPVSSAVAPPVKYSATAYKPGANTGSQTYAVTPGAYGTYGSNPSVYTNNNVVPSGTSAENGDVSGSQFKENNIYIAGQQSEGSTVWIPAPGRDLSALQSSSFYGLPPQGQHLAFAPAQAGHGAYGGMYHPAQTLAGAAVHPLLQPSQTIAGAVEMVGPPANGYQQPQHAQMNWANY